MRTDLFRARGTDGRTYIVFRRTQTYFVKGTYGPVIRQREPKFYLGNGDPLECVGAYDTFKTLAGDLVVRVIPSGTAATGRASTGRLDKEAVRWAKSQRTPSARHA
jgi:hypothetical protein